MSRFFWQVYLSLLGVIVLFFALSSALFWRESGPREASLLRASAAVLELALPPAAASAPENAARVEALARALGGSAALYAPDGTRLARAGERLPRPDLDAPRSYLMRHPFAAVVRLADGRWLVVAGPDRDPPHGRMLLGLVLLAALIAAAAWPLARGVTRRLEALTERVRAFGAGNLAARAEARGRDEIADLAAAWNASAERIERLLASQRALLASASHELRSPLARMRVAAELIGAEGAAPARTAELRAQLARDVAQLDAAVGELLAVSRLDLLGASDYGRVDLLALAAEEAARVGVEASGAPATLSGDARSLRQLLRNLIANARRHAAGAELWVHVEPLDAAHPARGARVRVEDGGPGVPEAERARLFDAFAKGAAAPAEGAGLGLAIARQIARHHGGDLAYAPREGGGSVFTATLPGRAEPPASSPPQPPRAPGDER